MTAVATTTLADVIAALGGDLLGDAGTEIDSLQPLAEASARSLAFLANPRYQSQLNESRAACVIVAPALAQAAAARGAAIITPDPYLYFARLTQWWAARVRPLPAARIHPSAVIDPGAQIGAGVDIGALAVVEAGARIGDGVRIGPHCVIERNACIGAGTRLAARVTVGFDCTIGERCIVHGGVVIGADGFGFRAEPGRVGQDRAARRRAHRE